MAAAALCGGDRGGDGDRGAWGGRGEHGGAAVTVAPDAGVAELGGLVRWLLSRSLARCAAYPVVLGPVPPGLPLPTSTSPPATALIAYEGLAAMNHAGSANTQGRVALAALAAAARGTPLRLPSPLLELCMAMNARDPWADGSSLFPVIATLGGLGGGAEGPSISADGLKKPKEDSGSVGGGEVSSSGAQNRALHVVGLSEFADAALETAATSTLSRCTAAVAAASAAQTTKDKSVLLLDDGRPQRLSYALGSLFSLGTLAVHYWRDATQLLSAIASAPHGGDAQHAQVLLSGSSMRSPQWIALVPPALQILLSDISISAAAPDAIERAAGLVRAPPQPENARADQTVRLVLAGREAELLVRFLTSALGAAPAEVCAVAGGGHVIAVGILRAASGGLPSWCLDALTLLLRALAGAGPPSAGNGGSPNSAHIADANFLCGHLRMALGDSRFPRGNVSDEAKQLFLDTVGNQIIKQDWRNVKNALKQLCGGKRKTGGRSLGRPPDHSPWESNFDSRSIVAI
jgi:hypothetical protein